MKNFKDNYVYKELIGDNPEQIYIIQNSSVQSRPPELSALQIANYWRTHGVNPGHDFKREDDVEFISNLYYVLYKIGPNNMLEVVLDRSNGSTDYLQILVYDEGEVYAAILPLLKKI